MREASHNMFNETCHKTSSGVIMNRLRGRTLSEISEVQCGFMLDRGTRNAIFVLRILVERMIEKQKDVYVYFIVCI